MLTPTDLDREAMATGFRPEPLEKVIRLIELLDSLRSHPFLKRRIALKGGTALNFFIFDVPRLSVDIDLNYIGAIDRETMLAEQPKMRQALEAVCGRLGIRVKRVPSQHAGGKWRLSYITVTGRPGTLELDVNFMLRTPLWPYEILDSHAIGSFQATQVPVLDVHELAAGKLAALFARCAARDLFDTNRLLRQAGFDRGRLRLGFVVYGAINRRDWRTVTVDDVKADPEEIDRQLIAMLRGNEAPARHDVKVWGERLAADCRELLTVVLPLQPNEREFLDRLNDYGEIVPELLTAATGLQSVIRSHPGLLWKAKNVKEHRRLKRG